MVIPKEYVGREQSYLKHLILKQYLQSWGQKLGSIGKNKPVSLWYVDCFSGPWGSKGSELSDSSISIGLSSLSEVASTCPNVKVNAIFIEKHSKAFKDLEEFIEIFRGRNPNFNIKIFHGEFGKYAKEVDKLVGDSPGFFFIDPKGWTGADMSFISNLSKNRRVRDVLINFMYEHINRFKDSGHIHDYIPQQMCDFFGLDDSSLPAGLDEESLVELYRKRLKAVCDLNFSADIIVPHPTVNKTKFRLVVGGNHSMVLDLFRKVEKKVMGDIAKEVRNDVIKRKDLESGQTSLFSYSEEEPLPEVIYDNLNLSDTEKAKSEIVKILQKNGIVSYEELWPRILESCHITLSDLNALVGNEHRNDGDLEIIGIEARERTPKNTHKIKLRQK